MKRQRTKYTQAQLVVLEKAFEENQYPDSLLQEEIAIEIGVQLDKISNWFQNRRSKLKRQSLVSHKAWMRKQIYSDGAKDVEEHLNSPFVVPELPPIPDTCHVLSPLDTKFTNQMARQDICWDKPYTATYQYQSATGDDVTGVLDLSRSSSTYPYKSASSDDVTGVLDLSHHVPENSSCSQTSCSNQVTTTKSASPYYSSALPSYPTPEARWYSQTYCDDSLRSLTPGIYNNYSNHTTSANGNYVTTPGSHNNHVYSPSFHGNNSTNLPAQCQYLQIPPAHSGHKIGQIGGMYPSQRSHMYGDQLVNRQLGYPYTAEWLAS